jgi:hypothetical protein
MPSAYYFIPKKSIKMTKIIRLIRGYRAGGDQIPAGTPIVPEIVQFSPSSTATITT